MWPFIYFGNIGATGWSDNDFTRDLFFGRKDLPLWGVAYTSELFGCGKRQKEYQCPIIVTQELYRKLKSKDCRVCAPVRLLNDSENEVFIECQGEKAKPWESS